MSVWERKPIQGSVYRPQSLLPLPLELQGQWCKSSLRRGTTALTFTRRVCSSSLRDLEESVPLSLISRSLMRLSRPRLSSSCVCMMAATIMMHPKPMSEKCYARDEVTLLGMPLVVLGHAMSTLSRLLSQISPRDGIRMPCSAGSARCCSVQRGADLQALSSTVLCFAHPRHRGCLRCLGCSGLRAEHTWAAHAASHIYTLAHAHQLVMKTLLTASIFIEAGSGDMTCTSSSTC